MQLKLNEDWDISDEQQQAFLKFLEASSPVGENWDISGSLQRALGHLKGLLRANDFWVVSDRGDEKGALWNAQDPHQDKEVSSASLQQYKQEGFYSLEVKEPFLGYQNHFIFTIVADSQTIWVGLSSENSFDQQPFDSFVLKLVLGRLKELCIYSQRILKVKFNQERFQAIYNQIPQAVVFVEENEGVSWLNEEAKILFNFSSDLVSVPSVEFMKKLDQLKNSVLNKDEVELKGNDILSSEAAFPSSYGEDWIWRLPNKVLKVMVTDAGFKLVKGKLWVFDNVSELYFANERLNSLFRKLNVAYDEIAANLNEIQVRSSKGKSITDLEAEESRIIQQYDDKDILGKVTHDLRTPFAKVYTIVQLLLTDSHENLSEQQVERISLIKQVVADGLQIVKGFLDTGNMVLDDNKYQPEKIEIESFVNESLVPYELLSAKKNITFVTQVLDKNMVVFADRTYLKRVIDNLVSNAIKFSPFDKVIEYTVQLVDGKVRFSVKDHGPGLTDDDKSRLFKKYQQLSAKPIGNGESTGLGLFIVKTMVDKMAGRIWVDSEHGKGANFQVEFDLITG